MGTAAPPTYNDTRATQGARFFPPKGSEESALLYYRDRMIHRHSAYRNSHMGRIALAIWYHLGKQWADLDVTAIFDGVRGAIIHEAMDDGLPRPVTNEIDPAVEVELIGLVKRQWIPKIVPTSADPRIKAAAQVSHDVLNYRLKQIQWPALRTQLALNYIVCGTALPYTAWDKTYLDLRTIGAPSLVYCPSCGNRLYSADLPGDSIRQLSSAGYFHAEAAQPLPLDDTLQDPNGAPMDMGRLSYCPLCPQPTPMVPGTLTPEETANIQGGQDLSDMFGRPLSVEEPRGNSTFEIDLPFEHYPEDGGIRKTPQTLRRWARRKIRSADWLEEHVPGATDYCFPDSPTDLLYDDPLLGPWGVLGQTMSLLDHGLLDNSYNVDEVVELPTMRNPLGRYTLFTKQHCLVDEDLLIQQTVEDPETGESQTLWVPRAQISGARYKARVTEYWGTTLVDHGVSPQNRLNALDAQIIETRLRMGSPNIFMSPGMWISGPAVDDAYGSGKIFFFKPDPANPQMTKPETFGGELFNDSVYLERDRVQADIKKALGPPDVKLGGGVKNVGTTSGLQLVNEIYDAQTSIREEELTNAVAKSWTHMQQLQWVLRLDPETYRVLGPDGSYKEEQYTRAALRGQYEVEVEKQSYISRSLYQSEAVREALADHLYVIDGPAARKKILEYRNLPTDVNEQTNNQIEQAERAWVDFVDKGIVRIQDPSIEDPGIHYDTLGRHLMSEEGQRLARETNWDATQRVIADWEQDLQRLQLLGQKVIEFYGGRLSPQDAEAAYAKAESDYQDQLGLFKKQQAIQEQIHAGASAAPGVPPPAIPPPTPPTAPPPPVFLPPTLQDRILMVWQQRIQGTQPPRPSPADAPSEPPVAQDRHVTPEIYLRFRALVDAYRLSIPAPVAPGAPGATMASAPGGPAGGPGPEPAPLAPSASPPEGGPH